MPVRAASADGAGPAAPHARWQGGAGVAPPLDGRNNALGVRSGGIAGAFGCADAAPSGEPRSVLRCARAARGVAEQHRANGGRGAGSARADDVDGRPRPPARAATQSHVGRPDAAQLRIRRAGVSALPVSVEVRGADSGGHDDPAHLASPAPAGGLAGDAPGAPLDSSASWPTTFGVWRRHRVRADEARYAHRAVSRHTSGSPSDGKHTPLVVVVRHAIVVNKRQRRFTCGPQCRHVVDAGFEGQRQGPESTPPTSIDPSIWDTPARQSRSSAASAPPTYDWVNALCQDRAPQCTPLGPSSLRSSTSDGPRAVPRRWHSRLSERRSRWIGGAIAR